MKVAVSSVDTVDSPPGHRLGVAVAMLAMMALPIGVTGANLAFPTIERHFSGSSRASLSWALSGYSIVIAAFTLLGGQLSDRLGSFKMFTAGIGTFGLFNLVAALAPSALVLVGARVLQGMGGALIVPSSLAVALARCPAHRRTFTIGVWTASFPIGSSFAPVLASLLLDWSGWRAVFACTSVLCAVALGLALLLGDHDRGVLRAVADGLPDLLGVAIGTSAIGLAALGIVQGRSWGWLDGRTLTALLLAAVLVPVFIRQSRRHPRPLINLDLFKIPSFRSANLANVLVSMVGNSTWLLWPLLMTNVWKYSQLRVGIAMTPTPVLGGLGSLVAARYAQRNGYRRLLLTGSVCIVASCATFVFLPGDHPNYWTGMFPGLLLMGVGMGMTFAPLNGAALVDVPTASIGQANGAFTTGRFLSSAIGIAMVVAALSGRATHPLSNFDHAFVLLTVIAALAAAVLFVTWNQREPNGSRP